MIILSGRKVPVSHYMWVHIYFRVFGTGHERFSRVVIRQSHKITGTNWIYDLCCVLYCGSCVQLLYYELTMVIFQEIYFKLDLSLEVFKSNYLAGT